MPRLGVTSVVPVLTAMRFMREIWSAEVTSVVSTCPSGETIAVETSTTDTGAFRSRMKIPPVGGASAGGVPASTNTVQPTPHASPVAAEPDALGPATTRISSSPVLEDAVGDRPQARHVINNTE